MEANRKYWNEQQQALRQALSRSEDHSRAIELFMRQHAMVHAAAMSGEGLWSFHDEVWQGLSEAAARRVLPGEEHSIAWLTWHSARIEDVTMGVLMAGESQLLARDGWFEKLKVTARDTGNLISAAALANLSAAIDIEALLAYRLAVGQRTRAVVRQLTPADLKRRVDPARLQRLLDDGAVVSAAMDVINYWGGLKIFGLLLMPPTRHNFIHLNEALRLKDRLNR